MRWSSEFGKSASSSRATPALRFSSCAPEDDGDRFGECLHVGEACLPCGDLVDQHPVEGEECGSTLARVSRKHAEESRARSVVTEELTHLLEVTPLPDRIGCGGEEHRDVPVDSRGGEAFDRGGRDDRFRRTVDSIEQHHAGGSIRIRECGVGKAPIAHHPWQRAWTRSRRLTAMASSKSSRISLPARRRCRVPCRNSSRGAQGSDGAGTLPYNVAPRRGAGVAERADSK